MTILVQDGHFDSRVLWALDAYRDALARNDPVYGIGLSTILRAAVDRHINSPTHHSWCAKRIMELVLRSIIKERNSRDPAFLHALLELVSDSPVMRIEISRRIAQYLLSRRRLRTGEVNWLAIVLSFLFSVATADFQDDQSQDLELLVDVIFHTVKIVRGTDMPLIQVCLPPMSGFLSRVDLLSNEFAKILDQRFAEAKAWGLKPEHLCFLSRLWRRLSVHRPSALSFPPYLSSPAMQESLIRELERSVQRSSWNETTFSTHLVVANCYRYADESTRHELKRYLLRRLASSWGDEIRLTSWLLPTLAFCFWDEDLLIEAIRTLDACMSTDDFLSNAFSRACVDQFKHLFDCRNTRKTTVRALGRYVAKVIARISRHSLHRCVSIVWQYTIFWSPPGYLESFANGVASAPVVERLEAISPARRAILTELLKHADCESSGTLPQSGP